MLYSKTTHGSVPDSSKPNILNAECKKYTAEMTKWRLQFRLDDSLQPTGVLNKTVSHQHPDHTAVPTWGGKTLATIQSGNNTAQFSAR